MNQALVKTFIKYVSLNVCGMIGLSCYILADTYFIANGVGPDGLTALNLILPLFSLMNGIGLLLGMGGATKYAHLLGAGKTRRANAVFTRTVCFGLASGLVITAAGFFSGPIVSFLGADATVRPLASVYLLTMYSFACAFVVNNIILAFVRNDGGPNRAMIAMIAGNLFNIVFDYIFIVKLHMGMFGAAFATGFSPAVSLLVLSGHWRRTHTLAFRRSKRVRCLRQVLAAGLPSFVTEFASGLIILLFNFTILKLAGNTGVAAYGIIANLALIVVAAFTGIAQGIQPIVSLNHGAGNAKNANATYFLAIGTAFCLGTICFLSGALFAEPIIAVFNNQNDPILASTALDGMHLYFTAFFFMGVNIVTSAFFSSVARFRESFLVSVTRAAIAAVPLILLLPRLLGLTGVWLAIPATELCTLAVSILFAARYFRGSAL